MSRPKCPNHTVEMDKSDEPRIYICPISSARFEVDVEDADKEIKLDKYGNPIETFIIKSLGGET